ncbi:mechanosensitive ion channel family protein [Mangrovibacterium lignilyticum]|uniref:mechanosensitive ion channel family protein n=1 Tax=Mangrovibacterium lignilyticum TaxID=2668052 RepID=UPI0013D5533D|nr:mechanosensitive ion channel domain-containing protein [Mangrovibacterium lignilyticum]
MKELIVFHTDGLEINLFQLVVVTSILISAAIITIFLTRFVRRFGEKHSFPKKFIRLVKQGIRVLFYLSSLAAILDVLKINYHQLFGHVIYANENYSIRVLNILIALIIIYLTRIFTFGAEYWMNSRIDNHKMDRGRGKSLIQILKYLIWILGFSIIASSLGLNMTFVIASISALLIGVGFGLQHIFNDFFSGIIILFDGSIKVDDIVEVEGTIGRVLTIGLRFSKVLTRDNVIFIVPNSRFTTEKVINWTHNKEATRFHVNVGVAYGSDVRLVEKILLETASKHDQIVKIPKPFVRFNDFGESSLDFQLYFWTVNDFLVENIKSDLRFEIDNGFRKNKVEIPFPQRDLHLRSKDFE